MSTISHPPTGAVTERSHWSQFLVTEVWASLAIVAMWLAVLFTAVFGPDFVATTAGGDTTTVPSGIAVALFASLGTWAVAKYGFGHRRRESD